MAASRFSLRLARPPGGLQLPAFVAVALLLVSIGVSMIWGVDKFRRNAAWVQHAYKVLAEIESVRSSVRAVESAARGFRLSGEKHLDLEYVASRPAALTRVGGLVNLLADDPPQAARAQALNALVLKRLAEIDASVELYRQGNQELANAALRRGRGVELMARLDALADEMRDQEVRALVSRKVATERQAGLLVGFVVLGMVVSLATLAVLLGSLIRENGRASRLGLEARHALASLEASLTQRERLAEQRRMLGTFAGLLHSCQTVDEAMAVTANALTQLVPGSTGACHVMRASQNLLETGAVFGERPDGFQEVFRPDQCWGVRRGHTHRHDPDNPTACCEHLRGLPTDDTAGVCIPLTAQGAVLGLLHVAGRHGLVPSESDIGVVEAVAEHLAVILHNLQLRETLRVQSLRDPLTGLYNRRYLEENLVREIERCARRGSPLSLLMLDIDHFKHFNDEHGHGGGDALLTKVGQTLSGIVRSEDIACRYGGEEFTIVMPDTTAAEARQQAERIREAIGASTVAYMRRTLGPVTASIGVAALGGERADAGRLMAAADAALYEAKAKGRNRVVQVETTVEA